MDLFPAREYISLPAFRLERSNVRLDEVEKDPVCVSVDMESVGDELLERASLAFGVAQRRPARVVVRGQRGGFLHDALVQVNQDDPRRGGGHLARRLRVRGADGSPAGTFFVPGLEIELGQADLVQWRRRDQQNFGFVRLDALMGDDLGQVLLVLLDRDTLGVRGDWKRSVVRSQQDQL